VTISNKQEHSKIHRATTCITISYFLRGWNIIQLPLRFRLLQRTGLIDIDTSPLCLNFSNGAHEPSPRPYDPTAYAKKSNNAYRHNGIIQALAINWICCRETEDDRDETNPEHANKRHGARCHAEVEGAFLGVEFPVVDCADEDRDAVRDIQSDCSDGSCSCKGN
jgi:hypothetical protein